MGWIEFSHLLLISVALRRKQFTIQVCLELEYQERYLGNSQIPLPVSSGVSSMIETLQIAVCRKPIEGGFADNVIDHGVACLDIDRCRIETNDKWSSSTNKPSESIGTFKTKSRTTEQHFQGRYPSNVIHDGSEVVILVFPEAGNQWKKNYGQDDYVGRQYGGETFGSGGYLGGSTYCDVGSASRYFWSFNHD